jgi:predicted amino acid dehydrogenase
MKEIIKISFDSAKDNNDMNFELDGESFHVRQLGVEYSIELALELVKKYKNECDAFAISGFPYEIRLKGNQYSHKFVKQIKKMAEGVPVFDGSFLRKAAIPWALKKYLDQDKHLLAHKTVAFYTGIVQWSIIPFFEDRSPELVFADIYFSTGLPVSMSGTKSLERFLKINGPLLTRMNLKEKTIRDFGSREARTISMERFHNADIFVVYESQLAFIKLNDLSGKTVIIDKMSPQNQERILRAGAQKIIVLFPDETRPNDIAGSSVMEAAIGTINRDNLLSEEDVLHIIEKQKFMPKAFLNPIANKNLEKFAFIIHPLSKRQITQIPGLEFLENSGLVDVVEKIAGKMPGYHYCKITGIKSEATGKEVEGDLFMIPSTPKMLLSNPVDKVYKSLVDICHKAHDDGAKIIGLGAYTKIVGDAGVTVNEHSPIPLTTGNSLSSASTLWAASFGLEKMGLVLKKDNIYQGTCMVIGATGSIGKVCAKILSKQWKRIVVVAPRPYKILELVEQLKEFSPNTEVIGTTNPNKYSPESDLIVTSTSAQGERILNIDIVKPGCVICDVSRPFDISLEDAAKRPDLLIIASGEVELPGEIKILKTIGLQGDTVYACLAETALLAMEGLFESFSLSRELSFEKVVQIDRLARKHGIRLAGIMGHTGEIKEQEIQLCREYAIKKLQKVTL